LTRRRRAGRSEDAVGVIEGALGQLEGREGIEALTSRSKLMLLQAQVYKRAGETEQYAKALLAARDNHATILARLRGEAAELVRQQRGVAANICHELARHHEESPPPPPVLTGHVSFLLPY
jgi:hypothetical protein